MNQHTYSFPKVTPVDPEELREDLEDLHASRRDASTDTPNASRVRSFLRAPRPSKG